jgi:hypothetical protein
MTLQGNQSRSALTPVETFSAFSMTAGLLLIWYLAGMLTTPGHSKILDAGAYAIFFGAGPALVWLIGSRIMKSSQAMARMQCAIAAQSILAVLLLLMIWLPTEILTRIWYVPALIHLSALGLLLSNNQLVTRCVNSSAQLSDRIVRTAVPILPLVLLLVVLMFSPDMRGGFAHFLQSKSFIWGFATGTALAIAGLWALRRQLFAPESKERGAGGKLTVILIASVSILLLADTRLPFDWIHYGTYLGPANAVLEGRFPMVDTLSQYGIFNYLVYSAGYLFSPHRTFTVAAAVSVVVNLATYGCIMVLAYRLWGIRWFVLVFGIIVVYVAAHLAPFQVNSYPNFRGMRFLPAALIAMAIASIPAGRKFTPLSIFAFCFSLLWSVEGAACAIGAYATYLVVAAKKSHERIRSITKLACLTVATYLVMTAVTVVATGEPPRFDLYLKFVFGFVSLANYSGANWLKSMNPRELIWVPLALLYFGIIASAWRLILEKNNGLTDESNRLFMARIAAVAACAILLLTLFVFRSLLVYLLIVAPLGIIIFFALTASAWKNASVSSFSKITLGLPFIMIVGLSTAILGNAFLEKNPVRVITHDVSAAHDWIRIRNSGFSNALQRLNSLETDYATGMSFPWKPNRMREGEAMINRWFPTTNRALVFLSESPAIFLRTRKDHRFPTAYPFSEGASTDMSNHIASARIEIREGEHMIVSNHPTELTILENRILRGILEEWDAIPVEAGKFLTVYRLTRNKTTSLSSRLKLPLQFVSATASSAISPLYDGRSIADTWEASYWSTPAGNSASQEWVQLDFGTIKKINRIELVPYWPAFDAFPKKFDVLVSVDNISWQRIAQENSFSPDWASYANQPTAGYSIDLRGISARFIRIEAIKPFSRSINAYILQIADIIAYEN